MTILITGSRGQLGTELLQRLGDRAVGVSRAQCDLSDDASVRNTIAEHQPEVVINCAAYTQVDLAEDEPDAAYRVNARGSRTLAKACQQVGAYLVQLSTDYVFHGSHDLDRPWTPDDMTTSKSVYGITKLAGEQFVLAECDTAAVVRTCGLYSHHGGNFVTTMLRLSQTHERVRVVADQRCTPTSVHDLAIWIERLIEQRATGIFHATNSGSTTWAEFARVIFAAAKRETKVEEISSEEFGAKVKRPIFSVLDCSQTDPLLELERRSWRAAVTEFVEECVSRAEPDSEFR